MLPTVMPCASALKARNQVKSKALIQRTVAPGDIGQTITHHVEQDAPAAALGFVDALQRADLIDVWRVLHMKRDIPVWMVESEDNE